MSVERERCTVCGNSFEVGRRAVHAEFWCAGAPAPRGPRPAVDEPHVRTVGTFSERSINDVAEGRAVLSSTARARLILGRKGYLALVEADRIAARELARWEEEGGR